MALGLTCPQCGAALGGNETFCAHCGLRVTPAPVTVQNAGTQIGVAPSDGDDLLLEKIRESTVGEYEVRGLIGRGGMASVFVAYDLALNRKVALKAMHPGLLGDSGMRERFRLEARLAARLDHPNIVTVHAVKERGKIVFFDLKLIDGISLDRLLRHRNGALPVDVARWITSKIADALYYAHSQGVVHRDMKPANVMVERRGECIVTDFGIAKATGETSHLTVTGAIVGTPAYMSPEQCLGGEIAAASDQYSLGIMAYELLTGAVPHSGTMLAMQLGHVDKTPPTPRDVNPAIPQHVSDAVMRMLEKNPVKRWPSLVEASAALLEGFTSTDAKMRREMNALVEAVPPSERKSLPMTPLSPMPPTMPTAVRVEDAPTDEVSTVPAASPRTDSASTAVSRQPWSAQRKRMAFAGAGVGAVVIVVAVLSLSGGDSTVPETSPDSAPLAAPVAVIPESSPTVVDSVVARVQVSPAGQLDIAVGDSARLTASAYNQSGEILRQPMRWTSSDTTAFRVSAAGWVSAIAPTRRKGAVVFINATAPNKKSGIGFVRVK